MPTTLKILAWVLVVAVAGSVLGFGWGQMARALLIGAGFAFVASYMQRRSSRSER